MVFLQMTEETRNAATAGSLGIITAIGVSSILGWFLIVGLLFSIQDYDATIASATGQPVTQIFLDTVGEKGAIVLMVIVVVSMFLCGYVKTFLALSTWSDKLTMFRTFSVTSNSRMMYAFARDGGIPKHEFFHKVDKRWQSPIRTGTHQFRYCSRKRTIEYVLVWLACFLSFCLGLPSLGSSVAFSAATSIATIGLYISYGAFDALSLRRNVYIDMIIGVPILLRVIYRRQFTRGPFHLGVLSYPVASAAVIWIAFISIVFVLPELNPVDSQTLNYAIVAVGIVVTYSLGFWILSAHKWFKGPVKQIEEEQTEASTDDTTREEVQWEGNEKKS